MTQRAVHTKKRILEAAETEFAEKGLYGARVDEIAARAAVNKRMLYAYFGDKEQLYVAVIEAVYARMAEMEAPILQKELGDAVESIRTLIRHYFKFLHDTPTFVRIVMWENLHRAAYLRRSAAAQTKGATLTLLRDTLQRGVANGVFRADIDVEATLLSVNQLCFSYFSNLYTFAEILQTDLASPDEIQHRADHVTDVILSYLK